MGLTAGAYSIPEVQRLVATLVASKPRGRIAEPELACVVALRRSS